MIIRQLFCALALALSLPCISFGQMSAEPYNEMLLQKLETQDPAISSIDSLIGVSAALSLEDIALVLRMIPQMAEDMRHMRIYMDEMRASMRAMPGMGANMNIMRKDMDSTMGRFGRMMPWGW